MAHWMADDWANDLAAPMVVLTVDLMVEASADKKAVNLDNVTVVSLAGWKAGQMGNW